MPTDLIITGLVLFLAGLAAGTVNSIAGGGSLFTLPLLIFLGLPPTVANATNRIAVLSGGIGASETFRRSGLVPVAWLKLAAPPALIGAVLGTGAALIVPDLAFQRILSVVLVLAAGWLFWNPIRPPDTGSHFPPAGTARWISRAAFFLVGVYGGFIQAGVGFIVLTITSANGLDLIRGNAVKAPLVFLFTLATVVLFTYSGMISWGMGLALAAGQILGATFGVRLQILKGQDWVRHVLTLIILACAFRLMVMG
ncbi:MAG TPA: integrase [Gemmatimonadetes bacterium]|nr:integrase [Gemmatimonadota bacterium]